MFFVTETSFGNCFVVPLKWIEDLKVENVFNYGTALSNKQHIIFYSPDDERCPNFHAIFARTPSDENCRFHAKIVGASGKYNFVKTAHGILLSRVFIYTDQISALKAKAMSIAAKRNGDVGQELLLTIQAQQQQQPVTADAIDEQFEYERKYLRNDILQNRSAMNALQFDAAEMREIRDIIDDDIECYIIEDILVMPQPFMVKIEEIIDVIEPLQPQAQEKDVPVGDEVVMHPPTENERTEHHSDRPAEQQNGAESNDRQNSLGFTNQATRCFNDSVSGDIQYEENVS